MTPPSNGPVSGKPGVVGIVSPGDMGSAIGQTLRAHGVRVVATVEGRSERTRRLVGATGIELVPGLVDVVAAADLVLSVAPPAEAGAVLDSILAAVAAGESSPGPEPPLVADLNAISPATVRALADRARAAGVDLVDGSISGPPPRRAGTTRIFASGPRAASLCALSSHGLDVVHVGAEVGAASAVKMSTAAMFKGSKAIAVQLLLSARAHGVVGPVLDELVRAAPDLMAVVDDVASSVPKSARFVGEMEEIASTYESVGLSPRLFEGAARTWELVAESDLAAEAPESYDRTRPLAAVVESLYAALVAHRQDA